MKPIILVLGLSGVGKTHTAKALSTRCSLHHIDIDRKSRGFAKTGFPPEWDKDVGRVDFALLAADVRARLDDQHQGAVLSFPTTYRFTREQFNVPRTHSIGIVLLWGALERCWDVRCERQRKNKGTTPSHPDYLRKNGPTFKIYKVAEYDEFRVEAFRSDGSRPSDGTLFRDVLVRLTSQGIDLTADRACDI